MMLENKMFAPPPCVAEYYADCFEKRFCSLKQEYPELCIELTASDKKPRVEASKLDEVNE